MPINGILIGKIKKWIHTQENIKSLVLEKKKRLQTINARKDVEKRDPSSTAGGDVNWYNHYGEQYGGSLKN